VGFLASFVLLSLVAQASEPGKDAAYECALHSSRDLQPHSARSSIWWRCFYSLDIEIVFMPVAVVFQPFVAVYGTVILWSMCSFIIILLFGYLYAIKKGALDWTASRLKKRTSSS
jgi:NADH-quinone oxidoreductase subunit A